MSKTGQIATVFGGTGFIGAQVVRELAKRGYTVKVASRVPERAYFLRPCGFVGQIVPFACDYGDEDSIGEAVAGAAVVVNCIGILFERRRGDFTRIHTELPALIAKACKKHRAGRFVHVSALACERGGSKYARSKHEGEKALRKAFPAATILRPSVVFGPEDEFFNMFAKMARYLPALPLIGGGHTRFQPVYVGDVADAVMAAIEQPCREKSGPCGRTYELGGPETVDFRGIYQRLFHHTQRVRALVPLPWGLAKLQALFMGLLPKPPLTRDQVESLKTDNVTADGALTLADLGITPTGMSLILPSYLGRYCPGGRYNPALAADNDEDSDKKRA